MFRGLMGRNDILWDITIWLLPWESWQQTGCLQALPEATVQVSGTQEQGYASFRGLNDFNLSPGRLLRFLDEQADDYNTQAVCDRRPG